MPRSVQIIIGIIGILVLGYLLVKATFMLALWALLSSVPSGAYFLILGMCLFTTIGIIGLCAYFLHDWTKK